MQRKLFLTTIHNEQWDCSVWNTLHSFFNATVLNSILSGTNRRSQIIVFSFTLTFSQTSDRLVFWIWFFTGLSCFCPFKLRRIGIRIFMWLKDECDDLVFPLSSAACNDVQFSCNQYANRKEKWKQERQMSSDVSHTILFYLYFWQRWVLFTASKNVWQ